jgi:peroxiredoxin
VREERNLMRAQRLSILGLAILLQSYGCTGEDEHEERHKAGDVLEDYPLVGVGDFRVRTDEFRSRVLLIHFFEIDSDECRAQVRQIKSLWFPHRGAGMNVLGVCPETDGTEILRTMKEWKLPYPVFLDPERRFTREFAPRKYPWNVVVGRDGRILLTEKGSWDRVRSAVKEAVQVKVQGPDHVRVQHLLIAFEGSVPGKNIERSKEDAAKLAAEVFERAKGGEDVSGLVKKHTSDVVPGIYSLANFNVEIDDDIEESERGNMVQSFGDVAFSLEVGEIGMTEYHSIKSRFGWHIIKRLE